MNIISEIKKGEDSLYMTPIVQDVVISEGNTEKVIKFLNGVMIIVGKRTLPTVGITTTSGAMYRSGTFSLTASNFSTSFTGTDVRLQTTINSTDIMIQKATASSSTITVTFMSATSKTVSDVVINFIAIGKWK